MNTQLPKLPLGISEFIVLREEGANHLYIDKTVRCLWKQLHGSMG